MVDLVELAKTVHAVDHYPVYLPENDFLLFLTQPAPLAAWVADASGRLVGHVVANSRAHPSVMEVVRAAGIGGRVGVVARLLVDVGVRRDGIGTQLLEQARAHIEALGRTAVLDVVASSEAAVSLYRRAGWRELGMSTLRVPGRTIPELVFASPA